MGFNYPETHWNTSCVSQRVSQLNHNLSFDNLWCTLTISIEYLVWIT